MSLKINLSFENKNYTANLHEPLDLSIPLAAGPNRLSAWYVDPIKIEPVRMGDWVGEVNQGASVNFRNIFFNPHGHGTHTESVGHISKEDYPINNLVKQFFYFAEVISITPAIIEGDSVITKEQIIYALKHKTEALIIRTLPNIQDKLTKQYSNSNPTYLHHEAAKLLCELNIKHLMLDTPSVDREQDGGLLLAHHAFWNYPENPRLDATITELVYIGDNIEDGLYFLNLQIAPFENDASPSRPVLFKLL
jgi:kynurenine formamidase